MNKKFNPLEVVRAKIVSVIADTIDPAFNGVYSTYPIEGNNFFDEISINILNYPAPCDWVFFKSTIEKKCLNDVFKSMELNTLRAEICGSMECLISYPYFMSALKERLIEAMLFAKATNITTRFASATGIQSRHVYIEFDLPDDYGNQKTVFILVIKKK